MELRDIKHSLPMQLLQAREAAMGHFRPMLREHGLTEQQWRVIRVLAATDELDLGELAKRSLLLAPSLTRILQFLERQNLITRSADNEDLRRSVVRLSAKGKRKYAAIGPNSEALYRQIESQYGSEKLAKLYALLEDLSACIGKKDANKC